MLRASLPVLALLLALGATPLAAALDLPPDSLWLEEDGVKVQGPTLKVPPQLLLADHVTLLAPVGRGLVVYSSEERDDNDSLVHFALDLADLRNGTNRRLLHGLDPFGEGTDWHLQRVQLTDSGRALLLRVRLPGTGRFVQVYKYLLDGSCPMHAVDESTPVWSDASADGSVRVRPTWGLTEDAPQLSDNERRYGSLIVAGRSTPAGRWLWRIARHDQIPPWAEAEISDVALSPDGRQAAYTNGSGLWLVQVAGGTPRAALQMPSGDYVLSQPVFNRDGKGLYFSVRQYVDQPQLRRMVSYVDLATGVGAVPREGAWGLCLVR